MLALVAGILSLPGCFVETESEPSGALTPPERGRVILIGIDGASPDLMLELLEAGRLPNLQRLRAGGAYGPLRSEFPLLSPRIWTTIATGKGVGKHGISGFGQGPGEEFRLSRSTDRKTHALWNIASEGDRKVAVVNWWATYPPEKVNGVIVSEHILGRSLKRNAADGEPSLPAGFAYPEEWESRLLALDDDASPVPITNPFQKAPPLPDWVVVPHMARWFEQDVSIARYALEIERETEPDLTMVLLTGIDRVSHSLWSTVYPSDPPLDHLQTTEDKAAAGARILRDYYVFSDAIVGRLLEGYGPNDLLLVLSDHGFEAARKESERSGEHHTQMALDGVLFAHGPGIQAGTVVSGVSIRDITPTVLSFWGWPPADDMDGTAAHFLPAAGEVGSVETYDIRPIEYRPDVSGGVDQNLAEQLRALGYLK